MNETENNTRGGPGTEAKAPHVLDFNGTEIRPGLWAVDDAELQRIGNAAYQAGRAEREGEVDHFRTALEASSARVEELRAALETAHQREMKVAGMLGCAPADVAERIGKMLFAYERPREAGIAQLREALDLAAQQQTKIAAALGLESGEDVLAEVANLYALANEVVKHLGFGAEQHFALALNRYVDDEVEKARRRLPHEEIVRAVEAAETRTRKACADQLNAAQAMIDRATKEHEEERAKLYARIADVEKQRDESREAHDRTLARVTELENEEIRRQHAETIASLRRARGYLKESDERWARFALNVRAILGAHDAEETLDAARRVVSERDAATKANACPACGAFSGTIRSTPGCTCGQA